MTPDELTGRMSNQAVQCKHNSKQHTPGLCKECKEKKADMVFLLCKGDKCDHDKECGYFWGFGSKPELVGKKVIFMPKQSNDS